MTVLVGGGQSARAFVRGIEKAIAVSGAAGLVSFGLVWRASIPNLDAGDIVVDSDDAEWLDQLRAMVPERHTPDVFSAATR